MSAMKLVVEPPATVGLGLCSATIRDVSQDFLHCIGAERVETLVCPACQLIGFHSEGLRLPREACFDQERWY